MSEDAIPGLSLRPQTVASRIVDAMERRRKAGLGGAATDAYRLVHARWDGLPELRIERLGAYALVKYRDDAWATPAAVDAIVDGLRACSIEGATFVYDAPSKDRTPATDARDADLVARMEAAAFRPPEETVARENGRAFSLSARDGYSTGLFYDMRSPREDLAQRWSQRRVLNLFSYTCGFGVALAGHNDVVNVDTSRRILDWGARNYALNGLDAPRSAFVKKDAFAYLEVAAKVGNTFDAIVLDPPSYSAGKKGKARRFTLRTDFEPLVAAALSALSDDGELFVSTNWEGLDAAGFAEVVTRLAAPGGRRIVRTWEPGPDFPCSPAEYHLKTALVSRLSH